MKVLLHTCCGPCATHCVRKLRELGHEPVLFFSNANICSRREFDRRLLAARTLADQEGVLMLVDPPDHKEWRQVVATGVERAPEGGERCERCFRYSLGRTLQALGESGCEAFTTSLTVSPHKRSETLLRIGSELGGAKFLPVNFKKENGYAKSVARANALGLYRQNFCGCEFSRASLLQRILRSCKRLFSAPRNIRRD